MKNNEKILELKKMRNTLILLKEYYLYNNVEDSNKKEKVKQLVLKKKFYGKELVVG